MGERRPAADLGELPLAALTLVRQFAELARRRDPERGAPSAPVDALTARSPCDACRYATRCAAERCACEAFAVFVSGRPEPHWQLAPRVPSRARYLVLFEEPLPRRAGPPLAGRSRSDRPRVRLPRA